MINTINHYALTAHPSIHDEEAMSTLELMGRLAAKLNEIVGAVNETTEQMANLPTEVENALNREIANGRIADIVGDDVLNELGDSLDALNRRINQIIASSGNDNTEVVDMRTGHGLTYDTAGDHLRAVADGSAFHDAVRPSTVQHGRIMAGMMGGTMADVHTVQRVVPLAGKWGALAGYYDKPTRSFVGHSGYNMSARIPAKYGDTFVLDSYLFGPRVYPMAVLNSAGAVLEVVGRAGESSWTVMHDAVTVGHPQAAYVQFICGVGYESKFRAYRVTANRYTHPESAMESEGYIRMIAKKRTDTVTDRAQVKVWFKLPENRALDKTYTIPVHLFEHANLAGMTFRLFGAISDSSYDQSLSESAAGYTFDPNKDMEVSFKVPQSLSTNGIVITHVCLFVDFLPTNGEDYMNVAMAKLRMEANGIEPIEGDGYSLHGALDSDRINVVCAGAFGSHLHGKRILGIGDSLMRGNTLTPAKSWFNLMAGRWDMDFRNAAVNGQSVVEMSEKIAETLAAFPAPDFFVLNGGANDLRLSLSVAAFREAVSNIVTKVRENNPRCKILCLTNWQRSAYENTLGHVESDYVEAMLEVCEGLNVVCLNNYAESLNLTDPAVQSWADEGTVSTGTANLHFSEEANRHLVPRIAAALAGL